MLLLALALFAAVTVVRFAAGSDISEGITLLYTLPIGLLAVRHGPRGGLAGAALGPRVYWDRSESPEEFVARADAALYQAKSGGRDRVVTAA